ncbi:MAG: hypothetical protein ACT4P6_16460 [Gemmatimonadaceae bacterium]
MDRLLFRHGAPPNDFVARPGRNLASRQAFALGAAAMNAWQLSAADSHFQAAVDHDRTYGRAHLWLALARSWRGVERARWNTAAQQALQRNEDLVAGEAELAAAIAAEANEDSRNACERWWRLTREDSTNAYAWFGSAHCQVSDISVVRDLQSPSGWRFRTSYHKALHDYRRAFRLLPAMLFSFRDQSFESLRALFKSGGYHGRDGRATPPDTGRFYSQPTWMKDSLVFIPYPVGATMLSGPNAVSAYSEAVRNLRRAVRDVSSTWVASFPNSVDARHALAISLAMLGDDSALDTLTAARALARTADELVRVLGSQVWMQVAFSLQNADLMRLRRARDLADSLLQSQSPGTTRDPLLLASLAALTGRAHAAANYSRTPQVSAAMHVPVVLRSSAAPLLVYSALGGPFDSLVSLEERSLAIIDRSLPPSERTFVRNAVIIRAASMAFPTHTSPRMNEYANQGDWLVDLQTALARRDTSTLRHTLDRIRSARRTMLPETLTLDALYPEAELLAAVGDTAAAAKWLDPTFATLPQISPNALASPLHAGSLVRAMALRARLGRALRDQTAVARWGRAVQVLWSDADHFLQPVVSDMQALLR